MMIINLGCHCEGAEWRETAQTAGRSGEIKEAAKALHILQSVRLRQNDMCQYVYVLLQCVLQSGLQS